MFFNGLREAGRPERGEQHLHSLCETLQLSVVVPPATYHASHNAISRLSECDESCVDFNAKIGGNSHPDWVVYKQVKSKRDINEVPSYEMTQCVDIIKAFLSLSFSLSLFLQGNVLICLFKRRWWQGLLSIYLFSKYVSSYLFVFGHKNSISPSNNNHNYSGGRPLLHSPAKCRPRGRVWDWDLPSSWTQLDFGSMLLMLLSFFFRELQWIFCQAAPQTKGFEVTLRFSPSFSSTSCSPSSGIELPPEFLKV